MLEIVLTGICLVARILLFNFATAGSQKNTRRIFSVTIIFGSSESRSLP